MSGSTRETPIRLVRCKASAQDPIQVSETRLNTKAVVRSSQLYSLSFSLRSPVGFASINALLFPQIFSTKFIVKHVVLFRMCHSNQTDKNRNMYLLL